MIKFDYTVAEKEFLVQIEVIEDTRKQN
jgi:hypothetical protein